MIGFLSEMEKRLELNSASVGGEDGRVWQMHSPDVMYKDKATDESPKVLLG